MQSNLIKFVIISDTHGQHHDLHLPEGDILIHAGDFCHYGGTDYLYDFLGWFGELDYEHKILVAGNHDFFADEQPEKFQALLPPEVTYLNDSGTAIHGLQFWGSPVQPDLTGWAFGRNRGAEMDLHWELIPENVDVLITHTPPYGILDSTRSGQSVGCDVLSQRVPFFEPGLHVFGHVHASYGKEVIGGTTYINAANMNSKGVIANPPMIFEWNIPQ